MKFFNPKVIYETPDGENCLQKTYESTKLFTAGGLWLSSLEMFAMKRPTNFAGIASRAATITLPAAGIGATYASVSCLLGSLRNKDDEINHLIAGAMAGSIVGMKGGKPLVLLSGAVVGGLVAYFPKYFCHEDLI